MHWRREDDTTYTHTHTLKKDAVSWLMALFLAWKKCLSLSTFFLLIQGLLLSITCVWPCLALCLCLILVLYVYLLLLCFHFFVFVFVFLRGFFCVLSRIHSFQPLFFVHASTFSPPWRPKTQTTFKKKIMQNHPYLFNISLLTLWRERREGGREGGKETKRLGQ